jgi:peptidyl-prolyl cis-trans isomerase C
MRNFYAENADRFQSKKVHVAHVLIRTNPKMSEQEREALLTKAQEVYSKAMSREDFAKLAEQYSDDALSAKKGGNLGWISEGSIDPAFSKAAFSMKQDETSQPIATPFGFHVIKIIDEAQVVKKPYESVKGDIRFELRQQAKKAEMDRLKSLVIIERRG